MYIRRRCFLVFWLGARSGGTNSPAKHYSSIVNIHCFPSGPGAKFEGLQRAADESGTGPCAQPMRLPGDPCRVGPKPGQKAAPRTISKQGGASAASDPRAKCGKTYIKLPMTRRKIENWKKKTISPRPRVCYYKSARMVCQWSVQWLHNC